MPFSATWFSFNSWPVGLSSHDLFGQSRKDLEHMLELSDGEWFENPACHATWSDEDFIGRISRISRRTHSLTATSNTIKRALGYYRREWAKEFDHSYLEKLSELP